ncbi:MAG TPA: PEP/pyruvate-binding domain-containing protein [Thermoanaerobaculia bacterium]|nr:PEP/pyruvate-binding domain-containing protein [Thermoanaerobaculia bacterium]
MGIRIVKANSCPPAQGATHGCNLAPPRREFPEVPTSTPPTLLSLSAIDPDTDARFGGKALGLARLLRAGARVPEGFAVTAQTLPTRRWQVELRQRFIGDCEALLRHGRVAVRSSALVEDQSDSSFAGLFETVLDVGSVEACLAAADRCIASASSERVLAYAGAQARGGGTTMAVGLVVQRMAPARAAGTLFTRDPLGADGGLLIEATAGLGESLVAGRTDPERWRVYRSGLGAWECRRERGASGVAHDVLDAAEVELLADSGARFAAAFGAALDLEWVLAGAPEAHTALPGTTSQAIAPQPTVLWLQARPITSLVDPPRFTIERSVENADDGPVTVWSNWNVRETMPDALHPLTWSLWRETVLPFLTERFFGVPRTSPIFHQVTGLDRIQGRIYFNLNAALATPGIGPLLRSTLRHVDARAGVVVEELIARGVLTPRRLRGAGRWALVGAAASALRSLPKSLSALRPERCLAQLAAAGARVAGRPPVTTLGAAELVAELRLWESEEAGALRDGMQLLTATLLTWIAAERLFAPWPEAQRLLAAGIRGNPTTEISVRIDELIVAARPLAALFAQERSTTGLLDALGATGDGRDWLDRFRLFLELCGQRGPREFDLAAPRWSDDPTMVLDLIRLGLDEADREPVGRRLRRLAGEREAAIAAAVRSAPAWKRPLLRRLARRVARTLPLREAPKHYGLHVFQRMRRAALELGRRLADAGVLADADEVFFLELGELDSLARAIEHRDDEARPWSRAVHAGVADRIEHRRRLLAEFQERPAPDFVRSDGVPVDPEPTGDVVRDGELVGTGVSSGLGSGVARVLDRPDPHAFRHGDVLVVAFADPGWTPLFPRAAALVMEVGGVMCHAAVVARELGVPAVFGVPRATELLAGGPRVSVDGSRGVVRVLG